MKLAKLKRMLMSSICFLSTAFTTAMCAYAAGEGAAEGEATGGELSQATVVQGFIKLLNDALTVLLVLAPLAGGVCVVFFLIRRSAADEMDQKKWNNRIVTAVISTIGAVVGVSLLNMLLGYFQ